MVLLFFVTCSSPPSTPESITVYRVQTIVRSTVPAKTQTLAAKPKSSLPTVTLNSTLAQLQLGQTRVVLMDKDIRAYILSRALLYNDRVISDIEALLFEAQKLIEGIEAETDSLGPTPLIAIYQRSINKK